MAEAPRGTVRPMTPEELRQAEVAEQNRITAEVEDRDPMNGPEGGRYLIGGRMVDGKLVDATMVDAEGKAISEKKD